MLAQKTDKHKSKHKPRARKVLPVTFLVDRSPKKYGIQLHETDMMCSLKPIWQTGTNFFSINTIMNKIISV